MKAWALFFASPGLLFAQNSSVLKKASKFMPSLSEVGFVTGAINCYVQTASLVRAVNKEISLAKSMAGRLDQLKAQTEDMYGDFKSLSEISPYNMDTWASWLDRAEGLVSDETNDFVDILFHSVLRTLDDRMSTGFYSEVKRGLSYDAQEGNVKEVLRAYYLGRDYENNLEKVRGIALNNMRVRYMTNEYQLSSIRARLASPLSPPEEHAELREREKALVKENEALAAQLQNPAVGGTTLDQQIAYLMDMAQSLGAEFAHLATQLEAHQKDLIRLNEEWVMASKNKLPKDKNTAVRNTPSGITRNTYDPQDADRAPAPVNDPDKPTKSNVSHTGSPTSMADLLQLQNKIEFKKLEMSQTALQMELFVANARAALLGVEAYQEESLRNNRTNNTFGSENLAHALDAIRKERKP